MGQTLVETLVIESPYRANLPNYAVFSSAGFLMTWGLMLWSSLFPVLPSLWWLYCCLQCTHIPHTGFGQQVFAFHLASTSLTFLAVLWFLCITHSEFNLMVAVFYLLAKVEEAADKPIYRWTHHVVSGHTLKHLFAAMVPVFLTLMLAKRSIETQRYFVFSCCDLMNLFLLPWNFNVAFEWSRDWKFSIKDKT